jgi:hypothetical protein
MPRKSRIDAYLAELVRYIHLNPLRAGLVPDIAARDRYPYAGHSVLMGHAKRDWQDTQRILSRYGKTIRAARTHYRQFVQAGVVQGRRNDVYTINESPSQRSQRNHKKLRKVYFHCRPPDPP